MENNAPPSVEEAKAGFCAAADELRPLRLAMEANPFLLLGIASAVGIIYGRYGAGAAGVFKKIGPVAATVPGSRLFMTILGIFL